MNIGARSWGLDSSLGQGGSLLDGMRNALGQLVGHKEQRLEADLDGARCLKVFGALDKGLARAVKARAREFVSQPQGAWTIDLHEVTSWDSEGLASLVYALDVSELNGHALTLVDPCEALRFTLEKAQLHHLFAIEQRRK
jgi:anti-anti-sigma factor